jgi:membrane protein YdbS with pleckstrin-like domain
LSLASLTGERQHKAREVNTVLWTIFVILLIAWILGLVGVYQIGSIIWLLLVAAVVVLILQLVTGRRTVV